MAKHLILLLEILFIQMFIFYIAIFHSSLSVVAFMFFECTYIVLTGIDFFLLRRKKGAIVLLVQFLLFATGLILLISEASFEGLKEKRTLNIPYAAETFFLGSFLLMICSVLFLVYEKCKKKTES